MTPDSTEPQSTDELEPVPFDEALTLARTSEEIRAVQEADRNGTIQEVLDIYLERERSEGS